MISVCVQQSSLHRKKESRKLMVDRFKDRVDLMRFGAKTVKTASSEKVLVFKVKTHILKWVYGYKFIDYEPRDTS